MEVNGKIFLTWSILLLLIGGATAVAIGSIDPETHDFKLKQLPTIIDDKRISLSFEMSSFNRDANGLNETTRTFAIDIPVEQYNTCRNGGDSARDCKEQLVSDIELVASDNLFTETLFLRRINVTETDFSNELNTSDFDVDFNKINNRLEEKRSG